MQLPQLFIKSNLSFLDSAISIEEIIDFSLKNNHSHTIITEVQEITAFATFYFQAIKKNLIPICSLNFFWNNSELLLIAKNFQGYQNLLKISNYQNIEEIWLKNIIVIHLDGIVCFENHEDFYIANCDSEKGVHIRKNSFLKSEDYDFLCFLFSTRHQNAYKDALHLNFHIKGDYLIQNDPENVIWEKNLEKIINSCVFFKLGVNEKNLDFFDNEPKKVIDQLREIAITELKKYVEINKKDEKIYLERLNYEIEIIETLNFADYFFIVYDLIDFSKKNNILIGIGRGSVCGSLLAFLLNITGIDPIKNQLYFERFLNLKRVENPDIDIDIDSSKKHLVINYLTEKYGQQNVAMLSVIQKFKFKSAFNEVLRSLSFEKEQVEKILFFISKFTEINDELITKLNTYFSSSEEIKKLFFFTQKLINWPKSLTIHPAGIIISKTPIHNLLPSNHCNEKNIQLTKYTSENIQSIGIIKFDLLSLNNLELISDILQRIEKRSNKKIDINQLVWEEKAFNLLEKKYTMGIFQLEGEKMTEIVSLYKPKNILDLANIISLLRPGASKQIDLFLSIKNNIKKPYFIHNNLVEILKKTHGLIIYQEQIMEIVSKVTNCTFSESDVFRKAIAKKNKNILDDLKNNFFERGKNNNFLEADLIKIWDFIYEFANFGFNKSHAIAYATISYQLTWFKFFYPQDFFASLLKVFGTKKEYLKEIYQLGFCILPANINNLFVDWEFNNKKLYWPITKINFLNEALFKKLEKLMVEKLIFDDLISCIYHLIKQQFLKKEILFLNDINFFNVLFKEKENNDFLSRNLDKIYNSIIFVDEEDKQMFNAQLNYVEEQITLNNDKKISDVYGIEFLKETIPHKLFQKHNAQKLIFLNKQNKSTDKYLGYIKSIKQTKKHDQQIMFWLEIFGCNYSSAVLPCFESLKSNLLNSFENKLFLFSLNKYNNKIKISSFYEIKND